MDRFKKILVAASPGRMDAFTLRAAVKLAEANNARLSVLDVVSQVPRWGKTMQVGGRTVDIEALLLRDRNEQLRRLFKKTRGGSNTEVLVTVGEPHIEVIRHVLTHGDDLVIVGAPGAEKGTAPQLDSGVLHLLRKCPVPVWVMRPSRARKLRILALVDPDPSDTVRDGLNNLVLQLATSLASREGGELHVGHAWSLPYESTLRLSPYLSVPRTEVDAMCRALEAARREEIDALVAPPPRERARGLHPFGVGRPARGAASLGGSARHRSDRHGHRGPHRPARSLHGQHRRRHSAVGGLLRARGEAGRVRYAGQARSSPRVNRHSGESAARC